VEQAKLVTASRRNAKNVGLRPILLQLRVNLAVRREAAQVQAHQVFQSHLELAHRRGTVNLLPLSCGLGDGHLSIFISFLITRCKSYAVVLATLSFQCERASTILE